MYKKTTGLISIIIPLYNGQTTIVETIKSVLAQNDLNKVSGIYIINDGSTDQSIQLINKLDCSLITIINHQNTLGLSKSINDGLYQCRTKYVLIMHQDIILPLSNSLILALKPFRSQPRVFSTYPTISHPKMIWLKYNFWQKCLFCRYVDKKLHAQIEKFDCYNRLQLLKLGGFNEINYKTAGEDIDLIIRIRKNHLLCLPSEVFVVHIHNQNPNFGLNDLIHKENQLAESRGVLLRKYGIYMPIKHAFFREVLLLLLLFPQTRIVSIILIIAYTFLYTLPVFLNCYLDFRIIYLPFINLYLFFSNAFFSIRGFILNKQLL